MEDISIARRIWCRSITMLLVYMRFDIEIRFITGQSYKEDLEFAGLLWQCFNRIPEIFKELTPNEKILMQAKLGGWPRALHTQYSWHVEGISCLLWCLNEIRLPPHDGVCDFDEIDNFFGRTTGTALNSWTEYLLAKKVSIRNGHEIQQKLIESGIVYQRCMISNLIREGERKIGTRKYSDLFSLKKYTLPIGPSGDIIAFRKEFCDLAPHEEASIAPISVIRLQSFKWAMDPTVPWDDMDMSEWNELPK